MRKYWGAGEGLGWGEGGGGRGRRGARTEITPSRERLRRLRFMRTWSRERDISVTNRARSTIVVPEMLEGITFVVCGGGVSGVWGYIMSRVKFQKQIYQGFISNSRLHK